MKNNQKYVSLIIICSLLLCSCGNSETRYQKQYDLGVKYLTEGNYEEAIIAFEAAINIDDKRIDAYLGLADAYLGNDELALAEAPLLTVLDLDPYRVEIYLRLVDIYMQLNETPKIQELLKKGYQLTKDENLLLKLQAFTSVEDNAEIEPLENNEASDLKPDVNKPLDEAAAIQPIDPNNQVEAEKETIQMPIEEVQIESMKEPTVAENDETEEIETMIAEEGTLIIAAGETYEIDAAGDGVVIEYAGENAKIEELSISRSPVLKSYDASARIYNDNSFAEGLKKKWTFTTGNGTIKRQISVTSGKLKLYGVDQVGVAINKLDHPALMHLTLSAGESKTLVVENPYSYDGIEYTLHCNTAEKFTSHNIAYYSSGEILNDYESNKKFYRPMRPKQKIEITMLEGSAHYYAGYGCFSY